MPIVSITRLHLRAWRFYPPFLLYTLRSARQARRSGGFRQGMLLGDRHGGQWTITMWDGEAEMRAFRNAGAHKAAMPRLLNWCDEASFTHFDSITPELPSPADAYEQLSRHGKTSKVIHPSAAQRSGHTVGADHPRAGLTLKAR